MEKNLSLFRVDYYVGQAIRSISLVRSDSDAYGADRFCIIIIKKSYIWVSAASQPASQPASTHHNDYTVTTPHRILLGLGGINKMPNSSFLLVFFFEFTVNLGLLKSNV